MIRYLADENLNNHVVRSLRLRDSHVDIVTVQEVGLRGADDPSVLAWAAEQRRIVVTHDVSTMTRYAYERTNAGEPMPGVVEVSPDLEIARVVEDLVLHVRKIPGDIGSATPEVPMCCLAWRADLADPSVYT